MGPENKSDYVLMAMMADGTEVEIGDFSDISITEMEEILEQMEFRRVTKCKNCEYRLRSECPLLKDPEDEFYCATGIPKGR